MFQREGWKISTNRIPSGFGVRCEEGGMSSRRQEHMPIAASLQPGKRAMSP